MEIRMWESVEACGEILSLCRPGIGGGLGGRERCPTPICLLRQFVDLLPQFFATVVVRYKLKKQ